MEKQIMNGKDKAAIGHLDMVQMASVASTATNPFDLARIKLSQDFEASGGAIKRLITAIPIKKPNRQAFIRAFGAEFQVTTAVIELKGEQDGTYLVSPELREELMDEIQIVHLVVCVDRTGNLFVWPIKMAKAGDRTNPWHESALRALGFAQEKWVRISANMNAGHYDAAEALANIPAPAKPDLSLQQIVEIAFKGKLIDSADHPVLKKLRGEE